MTRCLGAVALTVFLGACELGNGPDVVASRPDVATSPRLVEVGDIAVGDTHVFTVQLDNSGGTDAVVDIEMYDITGGGFEAEVDRPVRAVRHGHPQMERPAGAEPASTGYHAGI